jgi:capsular polysaccharide biosynthesis protein
MFGGAISSTIDNVVSPYLVTETFEDSKETPVSPRSPRSMVVAFLTLLVVFLLMLVFGKYLWNSVLVELIPAVKPAKSIWQIMGLSLLLGLVLPGCSCVV